MAQRQHRRNLAVSAKTFIRQAFLAAAIASPTSLLADDIGCGPLGCATDPYGISGCAESCTDPLTSQFQPPFTNEPSPIAQPMTQAMQQPMQQGAGSLFGGGVEGSLAAQAHAPGYIDWAVPRTMFRLRLDSAFDNNRPDRAEFLYAQCGCAGGPGPGVVGPPPTVNGSVDYQEVRAYLEVASDSGFSVFGEVPVRFLQTSADPDLPFEDTGDANGFSDLEVGFKYALAQTDSQLLTFQLRTYIPTGNAGRGLGTDHVSLEPGFLYLNNVSDRVDVFAEVRDWVPIKGSKFAGQDFSGNVLRYGVGTAVTAVDTCNCRISPIVEFVGWTVFDGLMVNTDIIGPPGSNIVDASTTIVNAKVGVRTMFKSNGSTLYVGYGRSLTGQRWYEDIARLEYTIFL
jgi:hypothetical protein